VFLVDVLQERDQRIDFLAREVLSCIGGLHHRERRIFDHGADPRMAHAREHQGKFGGQESSAEEGITGYVMACIAGRAAVGETMSVIQLM
jgi:hypothetical protein